MEAEAIAKRRSKRIDSYGLNFDENGMEIAGDHISGRPEYRTGKYANIFMDSKGKRLSDIPNDDSDDDATPDPFPLTTKMSKHKIDQMVQKKAHE